MKKLAICALLIVFSTLSMANEIQTSIPGNSIKDGILINGIYGFMDTETGKLVKVSLSDIRNPSPHTSIDIKLRRHGYSYGCRMQSISATELACNKVSPDKRIRLSIKLSDLSLMETNKHFLLDVKFNIKAAGRFFPKVNQQFKAKISAE